MSPDLQGSGSSLAQSSFFGIQPKTTGSSYSLLLDTSPTVRVLCVNLARLWDPVVWSNTSLNVAMEVFLDVLNISTGGLCVMKTVLHKVFGLYTIS